MINWKSKYLEMKLKYINAKHKGGMDHQQGIEEYIVDSGILSVFKSNQIEDFREWLFNHWFNYLNYIKQDISKMKRFAINLFDLILITIDYKNIQINLAYQQDDLEEIVFYDYLQSSCNFSEINQQIQSFLNRLMSHLDINHIFRDEDGNYVKTVRIKVDIMLDRSDVPESGALFHTDFTPSREQVGPDSEFNTGYVTLSYNNSIKLPGPEIILCNDMINEQANLECKYFRPAIPPKGTIIFRDDLVYHASPHRGIQNLSDIDAYSKDNKGKWEEYLGAIVDINTLNSIAFKPKFQNMTRADSNYWQSLGQEKRSFLRTHIIPAGDAEVDYDQYILISNMNWPNVSPSIEQITIDDLHKISFLG
tara:strand:- start:434 stop:1525 length:1092 start_codon:yes stop_codon:yes gene_type:complete